MGAGVVDNDLIAFVYHVRRSGIAWQLRWPEYPPNGFCDFLTMRSLPPCVVSHFSFNECGDRVPGVLEPRSSTLTTNGISSLPWNSFFFFFMCPIRDGRFISNRTKAKFVPRIMYIQRHGINPHSRRCPFESLSLLGALHSYKRVFCLMNNLSLPRGLAKKTKKGSIYLEGKIRVSWKI